MKKVLIISYYWPPAGGPGVQRWLKFVKYLPGFGIEPVLYIPENPEYPMTDSGLINEVPENLKIIKRPIFEPYGLAGILSKKKTRQISSGIIDPQEKQNLIQKLLLYIRGNAFIPDARKFWIKPSVKYLKKYLSTEKIDTVITTGPPHSLHLIGMQLKRETGVKWIADFRDPWTTIAYHKKLKLTKKSREKHLELEKQVLQNADCIITTGFTTKKDFEKITSQPIEVITNGYDTPKKELNIKPDNTFTVSHIGNLLSGRNPENLWKAFGELIAKNENFKNHFKLKLIGKVSTEVKEQIHHFGLDAYTEFTGYVTHEEALIYQRQSSLLLLIEIDSKETRSIIPGKIFEYLYAKRPVFAIGPKDWDAAEIIAQTQSGKSFLYSEKGKIKEALLDYFKDYSAGNSEVNSKDIERFHRKNLTKKLSEVIFKVGG